ncbi:MAG: hypothetical protein R3Y35_12200 [Clostridia bacterium]
MKESTKSNSNNETIFIIIGVFILAFLVLNLSRYFNKEDIPTEEVTGYISSELMSINIEITEIEEDAVYGVALETLIFVEGAEYRINQGDIVKVNIYNDESLILKSNTYNSNLGDEITITFKNVIYDEEYDRHCINEVLS